jgi:DNA-binding CsgD family transcriptional regulator
VESALTERERRVLELTAVPIAESEIAEELGLETWEAKQLVRQVWSKVGVQNIAQARAKLHELV